MMSPGQSEGRQRPLTPEEAQQVFVALAARRDEIAFGYLAEGCVCRAQLMIEYMQAMGLVPGRVWAVSVGRPLAFPNPSNPRQTFKWRNHIAPTVSVVGVEQGVLVIDPSTQPKAVPVAEWAAAMRARAIEVLIVTTGQMYDKQSVTAVQPCNGSTAIHFRNGSTTSLPGTHPDRDVILLEARQSLSSGRPVGYVVDAAGSLLDLHHAHDTGIDSVKEEDDSTRLEVWCWGFSPVCYLTRDHPEFERIRATLAAAAAGGGRVWLTTHLRTVEGETEIWHKILDVRPLSPDVRDGRA
jgi:hypothetical protein